MKKSFLKAVSMILSFVMIIAVPVFAAGKDTTSVFTGDSGSLTVQYQDVDGDNVNGAEFTLYKIANFKAKTNKDTVIGTGYQSIIPGLEIQESSNGIQEAVFRIKSSSVTIDSDPEGFRDAILNAYDMADFTDAKTYKGKTDSHGKLVISEIEPAAYLLVETSPKKGYYASIPSIVTIPQTKEDGSGWLYDTEVKPKAIPSGNLKISKKVAGNAAEKTRAFHFQLSIKNLDDGKQTAKSSTGAEKKVYIDPSRLSYRYENTNGEKGKVKDGDILSIVPGNSVTIYGIPGGAKYQVTEKEANKNGYKTTSSGNKDNIAGKETKRAVFTNVKNRPSGSNAENSGEKNSSNIRKGISPKTGDMVKFGSLFCLAVVIAVMIIAAKKKRKQEE